MMESQFICASWQPGWMSRVKGSSSVGWKGAGGSEGCMKDCARSLHALKPAWRLVTHCPQ